MAINPKIKQKAEDIRSKIFGSEVRESLASGIEAISEDVEATIGRQSYVEEQFQNVIDETTDKDVISAPELIAARNGEANLKTRLDEEHAQVTAQLQQSALEVEIAQNKVTYAEKFKIQVPEVDDTGRLQRAIEHAESNGGILILASKDYKTSSTLRIKKSIKMFSEHNKGNTGLGQFYGAQISYAGTENAIDIFGDTGTVYGIVIENIHVTKQSGSTPNIGINYNGSEFFMREVRVTGFKFGAKVNATIGRIYDSVFSLCDVGMHLFSAKNLMVSGCNFWDNTTNHILMNEVIDSHIHNNWFEYSNTAILLTNEQNTGGWLNVVIDNNRFDTAETTKYQNTKTLVIKNVTNTKPLFIQNSMFKDNLCHNANSDHNLEIVFTGLHSGSFINKFQIKNNTLYGSKISAIKGDSNTIYLWLERNHCRTSFFGGVSVPETSGQLVVVGFEQGSFDVNFRSPIRLASSAPIVYNNGQMWYDSSSNSIKCIINGVVKTINVT